MSAVKRRRPNPGPFFFARPSAGTDLGLQPEAFARAMKLFRARELIEKAPTARDQADRRYERTGDNLAAVSVLSVPGFRLGEKPNPSQSRADNCTSRTGGEVNKLRISPWHPYLCDFKGRGVKG